MVGLPGMVLVMISVEAMAYQIPGPSCSKLMTSLVNVLLKFQTLITEICQYSLLINCVKRFPHFFNKKYQCIWL